MKILFTIIAVLAIATASFAYTYDGELDPGTFKDWPTIGMKPCMNQIGFHLHVAISNPDKESLIKVVEMITQNEMILGYSYVKEDVRYTFILDQDYYIQIEPVEKSKFGI